MRRMHFSSSAEGWTHLSPDEISPETFLGDDLSDASTDNPIIHELLCQ